MQHCSSLSLQVSQNWFGESERSGATLLLAMSNPLGLVLGQLLTPLMVALVPPLTPRLQVTEPGLVPLLNLAWFLPGVPGLVLTLATVTSSLPPSPPSPR